jgi:hypothetical protein
MLWLCVSNAKKSQTFDIFKVYITEIKRQIDKKVKIIRSDKGEEYYGRYDKSEQNPILFSKFLEKQGICA